MLSTDSGDSSDPLEKGQANATGSAKVGLAGANAAGPVPVVTGTDIRAANASEAAEPVKRPSDRAGQDGGPGLPRPAMPSPHRYQRRPARPRRVGWPLGHRRRPIPAARSRAHRHFDSTADGGAGRNHRHRRVAFDAACPALLDSRPPVGHQRVHTRFRGASAPKKSSDAVRLHESRCRGCRSPWSHRWQ
jgi:hypothetical protein